MGILSSINDWFEKLLAMLFYFILTIIIILLYIPVLSLAFTDARGYYLVVFYFNLLLSPLVVGAFVGALFNASSQEHTKLIAIYGICTLLLAAWFFFYFRGIISSQLIIWFVVTTFCVACRCAISFADMDADDELKKSFFRVFLLFVAAIFFFNAEWQFLKKTKVEGPAKVRISSIQGISPDVRAAIQIRRNVIVPEYAYKSENGDYIMSVAPIYSGLFSESIYTVRGDGRALNQIIAEIELVTAGRGVLKRGLAFIGGALRSLWGIVEGMFSMILHPINTLKGLWSFVCTTFNTAIHKPSGLITGPIDAINKHIDKLDAERAAQFGVDINQIRLPETCRALLRNHRYLIAGEVCAELGAALVPTAKVGSAAKVGRAVGVTEKAVLKIADDAPKAPRWPYITDTTVGEIPFSENVIKEIQHTTEGKTMAQRTHKPNDPTDNLLGKTRFYDKAREALESKGYKYFDGDKQVEGIWPRQKAKPDYIAEKDGTTIIGETKSQKEGPKSPSWRTPTKSDTPEFKKVRLEVKAREAAGKVPPEVGGHEIIIRGQIPDYASKIGETYKLPTGVSGTRLKGGYTVPASEAINVEKAMANCGKTLTKIDAGNGSVTYIFPL